ncbi:hypothetical protein [Nonomuraea jiangxiensis]|uniref:Uncharacterized protein n=1 Tax=Nonomuraea jiangxiensis TaxID=633440 RepID=A0A1G8HTE5_9ACTN|nr:hypothetical protein [Nonomuraea jiangxiensis]SDI09935.1 hypothetical protein SAMN05421869_104278 [Nonomuraea jiangxiensis]
MTDELESYLRTRLANAAERAPKAPPRFPDTVVSISNRRRTTRNALVAGVCVAAIAVPVSLVATRGTERADVATGTIAPSPAATMRFPHKDYTGEKFRIGEALRLNDPSENRPISLWYARTDEGTALCVQTTNRTGAGATGCRRPLGTEVATQQGSTGGFPEPATGQVMYFGTARDDVAGVTAVTGSGPVSGTIHQLKGAPQGIWTVTVPSAEKVTAFEFTGQGGERITQVQPQPFIVPEATAEPVGRTLKMPGELVVGLYEVPDKTLIWKLDGKAVGRTHALSPGGAVLDRGGPDKPLIDMDGKPMSAELGDHKEHWFGIASSRTARVELVFPDGTVAKATTRPDPWKIGGFRLFAGTQRHSEDMYRDGFRLIGYDKDGTEVWSEEHGPQ